MSNGSFSRMFILKVFRGTPGHQFWEKFSLPLRPGENVISALMEIEKNPINIDGKPVDPIVWEQGCLEDVCGSCSMLINGKPSQGCTALIANLLEETGTDTVTLAPFTKFPLIRDLMVDRSVMFENLKKVQGWVENAVEGDNYGVSVSQEQQDLMYTLSTCMTCGCCAEACPQVHDDSDFIGPAPISQARLFNTYPGDRKAKKRLKILAGKGGLEGCGQAQNCVRVCPKKLPLTESISAMGKAVLKHEFFSFFASFFRKKKK